MYKEGIIGCIDIIMVMVFNLPNLVSLHYLSCSDLNNCLMSYQRFSWTKHRLRDRSFIMISVTHRKGKISSATSINQVDILDRSKFTCTLYLIMMIIEICPYTQIQKNVLLPF